MGYLAEEVVDAGFPRGVVPYPLQLLPGLVVPVGLVGEEGGWVSGWVS